MAKVAYIKTLKMSGFERLYFNTNMFQKIMYLGPKISLHLHKHMATAMPNVYINRCKYFHDGTPKWFWDINYGKN